MSELVIRASCWRIEARSVGIHQTLGRAELLDRKLRAEHAPAKLLDLVGEPDAGATGRRELLVELHVDVGLGDAVGDPGGLVRAARGVADPQDVGLPRLRYPHAAAQGIDRLLAQRRGSSPGAPSVAMPAASAQRTGS